MPLAPEIAALLVAQRSDPTFARPGSAPISILEARVAHDADAARFTPIAARDEVAIVESITVPSRDRSLRARLYRPTQAASTSTLLWFHGGGWVTGSLDTADIAARALCARGGVTVIAVDYSLAPEAPWPTGLREAADAVEWAASNLGSLGGDDVLLVGGDSAGGNIAAVVALTHAQLITGQLLIYPVIDLDLPQESFASRVENGSGYYVGWADIAWAVDLYVPDNSARGNPTVSPSRSGSIAAAPPAIVVAVEFDPLRDEDRAYADQLLSVGVDVDFIEFPGLVHGAFDMLGISPAADDAMTHVAYALRSLVERTTNSD